MAEPTDIVLEFLRKHHFVKAEAALMAELKDRPILSCENALNWDLQLRTLASLNEANDSVDSLHEYRHAKASEKKLSEDTLPGRIASPPEKQLYVEYEPRKAESSQDPPEIASKSREYDDTMPFPGDNVSGPTYKEDNRGEILIQQVSRSLAVAQSASSSERLITDCNQTSKVNGERFKQYPIEHNNEGLYFQELSKDSTSFQHLPGLQSPSHQHELPWDGTKCNGFGTEVVKSPEPFACSTSGKEEAAMSKNENISLSSTKNKGKPNLPSAEGWPECLLERKDRQWTEGLEVTNSFITSSTSTGYSALKTCLPPLFLKHSQQEECMRMLMPDSADLRNQELTIGREKVRSGIIDHSHSSEMESTSNYIQAEGLPRLPPVKLHSMERNLDTDGQYEDLQKRLQCDPLENTFGFVTLADDQLDQEALVSGMKRSVVRPSVSEGIMESMTDELSGFAIPGERWYGDEYCNSDTYDDEDDPGYCRQPIEDEEWFLAYEIDYPSDNERARQVVDKNTLPVSKQSKKIDEDGHSFIEEESYFSGEEYYKLQAAKEGVYISRQSELDQAQVTSKLFNNDIPSRDNDRSKIDETEELSFVGSLPSWKGFMGQPNEVKHEDVIIGGYRSRGPDVDGFEDDNRGSARSGGILGSSDAVDIGSELKEESLSGGNSEGDLESLREQVLDLYGSTLGKFDPEDFLTSERGMRAQENIAPLKNLEKVRDEDEQDMILQYYDEAWGYSKRSSAFKTTNVELGDTLKHLFKNKNLASHSDKITPSNHVFEGFSFPSPSSTGEIAVSAAGSGKSLWSNRDSPVPEEEIDAHGNNGMVGPDNTLAAWKRKNDSSSPVISSREEAVQNPNVTNQWSESIHSTDEYASLEAREDGNEELDVGIELPTEFKPSAQEEDDTIGAQEEFRSMVIDEDQYEIFDLRIIHRKNRTGFEEAKEFPVMLNSIIAGRYHVTEYLGSAAFSKAIQAHDLHTGIDVCMKIIKNNKDFFDQSLDEIKLLKFINKHDPADKYHVLRLYDYFYHREHLFIVCELLRANLYEFHKFNRESGGEVYFTMPRLQSITRQCLEALEFLHGLGIIHCDLKPENILVKSYSRCEIKVIDLGSSCFQTDHLCSYVQSRSYRAPEVILGLPYDQKIDIWSMGCILAELSSGNVLFQNDSLTTLLARVVGILGPIDPHVLAKGRDTYKYFTRNHMLYERNQETGRLEYLLPKKTSLRHRIPMGDEGFVEFVSYLLQSDPAKRPTATEALRHPWLSFPYEPMSS